MRIVVAAFLAFWVLLMSGCTGALLVHYLEEKSEPPYVPVSADVVNPAYEGCRVQLKARAYTDEWLELRDIGVRCQALRLSMQTETGAWNAARRSWDYDDYRGAPLRSRTAFAQRVRMGAFELRFSDDDLEYGALPTKLPVELVNLPESWRPHAREVEGDDWELKMELVGNPSRTITCTMVENGRELVVRGVQRGNRIFPVHGIEESEHDWQMYDRRRDEFLLEKTLFPALVSLAVPALLLGIFRVLKWRPGQKKDKLAIGLMLALDAAAFLVCGGWAYPACACACGVVLLFSFCWIVRVLRAFGVDAETR